MDKAFQQVLEKADKWYVSLPEWKKRLIKQEKCHKLVGEGVTSSFCHYNKPCPVHR